MKDSSARFSIRPIFLVLAILLVTGGMRADAAAPESRKAGTPAGHSRIVGFHIDMNIAQFRGEYLKERMKLLAGLGYNTILWEVENNIRWETCPECVAPEAFTKEEFRDLLAYGRSLGLEPIPLLQTIGHCEYVLKTGKYQRLAELPERVDQY